MLAVQRAAIATKKVLELRLAKDASLSIFKDDRSPVTIADFAAQALAFAALKAKFPDDGFLGEESSKQLAENATLKDWTWKIVQETAKEHSASTDGLAAPKDADEMLRIIDLGAPKKTKDGQVQPREFEQNKRYWVMDPVDGTSRFKKGGQYAIALALMKDGEELLGVLACPNLKYDESILPDAPVKRMIKDWEVDQDGMGLMLSAVRGQGATVRQMSRKSLGKEVVLRRKSNTTDLSNLHFVDSRESPKTDWEKVQQLAHATSSPYPGSNIYSSHMRYADMILGKSNWAMVRFPKEPNQQHALLIHDHVGSLLICRESGLETTTLYGDSIDFTNPGCSFRNWGVVVACPGIHGQLVKRARAIDERNRLEVERLQGKSAPAGSDGVAMANKSAAKQPGGRPKPAQKAAVGGREP